MAAPFIGDSPIAILTGSAATAVPASNVDGFAVYAGYRLVRIYVQYVGSVTACVIRKLTRNTKTGVWHVDVSTENLDPLTPASGNEIRVFDVDPGDEITFQVVSIVGGTVTIHADGLES